MIVAYTIAKRIVNVSTLAIVENSTVIVTNSGSKSCSNAMIETKTAAGMLDCIIPVPLSRAGKSKKPTPWGWLFCCRGGL